MSSLVSNLLLGLTVLPALNVYASPITMTEVKKESADVQAWTIPEMTLNFFTETAGMDWDFPKDFAFPDSELRFKVILDPAKDTAAECTAHWPMDREHLKRGTFPAAGQAFPCSVNGEQSTQVSFTLRKLGNERRPELGFSLGITLTRGSNAQGDKWKAQQQTFYGEAAITSMSAPDGRTETDFLTCVYGAPFTGMHCGMHGVNDNHQDIKIEAQKARVFDTQAEVDAFIDAESMTEIEARWKVDSDATVTVGAELNGQSEKIDEVEGAEGVDVAGQMAKKKKKKKCEPKCRINCMLNMGICTYVCTGC